MDRTLLICEDCGDDNSVHCGEGKKLRRCVTCGCKFRDDPVETTLSVGKGNPLPTRTVTPSWVSVEDQLPEPGTTVLVINKGLIEIVHKDDEGWSTNDGYSWGPRHFTHWMPIPGLPENSE